jgi:hypothetical protein
MIIVQINRISKVLILNLSISKPGKLTDSRMQVLDGAQKFMAPDMKKM